MTIIILGDYWTDSIGTIILVGTVSIQTISLVVTVSIRTIILVGTIIIETIIVMLWSEHFRCWILPSNYLQYHYYSFSDLPFLIYYNRFFFTIPSL